MLTTDFNLSSIVEQSSFIFVRLTLFSQKFNQVQSKIFTIDLIRYGHVFSLIEKQIFCKKYLYKGSSAQSE